MAAIKEAEIEWLESMGPVRVKAVTTVDWKNEIEELRKKVDQLAATVKSSSFKGARPKKEIKGSPTPSQPNLPKKRKILGEVCEGL